jgi:hypothetical protein
LIGQGIVNAAIQSTGSAVVTNVLKVWVDGFKPSQVGLNSSADLINPPSGFRYPTISLSPSINVKFEGYAPILAKMNLYLIRLSDSLSNFKRTS